MIGGSSYQEHHPSGEASRTSRLLCVSLCVDVCVCACGCEYTRVYKYTCTHVCVPMEAREQLWILLFLGCYPSSYFFFLTGSLTGLELTEPAKTLAPYPHVPTDPPISASPELGLQE